MCACPHALLAGGEGLGPTPSFMSLEELKGMEVGTNQLSWHLPSLLPVALCSEEPSAAPLLMPLAAHAFRGLPAAVFTP